MKYKKIFIFFLFGFFFYTNILSGQYDDEIQSWLAKERSKALKGIEKFFAVSGQVWADYPEKLSIYGLSYKKVREFTLSKLKRDGIKLLSDEELKEVVKSINDGKRTFPPEILFGIIIRENAFNVSLRINESAMLTRNLNVLEVTTWYYDINGTLRDNSNNIWSSLSKCIDKFLIDYFRVNPQK